MEETAGMRIERLATAKGLPQNAELAKLFGVSYETLRKWRKGTAAPNRSRQARISELIGVAPEVFMHGAEGAQAGTPLRPDEARLLRAYRMVLTEDKASFLKAMESRAREVEELQLRIAAERVQRPFATPDKQRAAA